MGWEELKDKSIGLWSDGANELDNIAYYLYMCEAFSNMSHIYTQQVFLEMPNDTIEGYYKRARKYLRVRKIEKIRNGIR